MNNSEDCAAPIFLAAQSPIHFSMTTPSLSHTEEDHVESPSGVPVQSLTRSKVGEVADGYKARRKTLDQGMVRCPDRGLWLLHDAFYRQAGWLSLNEELVEPLSTKLSFQPGYVLIKRVWDVVASLILLGVLSPLMLLIFIVIRLESPGPALFRQRRVGKDGKEFYLWKFRSMHTSVPQYAPSPTSILDRRLTRVGRIIRRISLDELPQLLNVLLGEMSLVGPRPEMPFIVDRYTAFERLRLAVKPGITGLWQISPARAFPIHENLQYDLHYIRHQNLLLDSCILLRTITAVVCGVGAV